MKTIITSSVKVDPIFGGGISLWIEDTEETIFRPEIICENLSKALSPLPSKHPIPDWQPEELVKTRQHF